MSFSITPITNIPPPAAQEFPNFLTWQADGVDLGLADADTVNVTGGLFATRGTGENSNVITLSGEGTPPTQIQFQEDGVDLGGPDADTLNFSTGITATRLGNTVTVVVPDPPAPPAPIQWQDEGSNLGAADADTVDFVGAGVTATRLGSTVTVTIPGGGGGGSSVGVVQISSNPDPIGAIAAFDGTPFNDWESSTTVVSSPDWNWAFGDQQLHFNTAGTYRLVVTAFIQADGSWPIGNSFSQVRVDSEMIGSYSRTYVGGEFSDGEDAIRWTSQAVLQDVPEDSLYNLNIKTVCPEDTFKGVLFMGMTISVEKIA